jgi:MFS family permease
LGYKMPLLSKLKRKIFYGWVITITFAIIGCTLIGLRFSFGVYFKSLEAEFDLTRAMTSSIYALYMGLFAVFAVMTGWALDRYGPRVVVTLMGLTTGLSLLLTSQTSSLWQIFLSYSLLLAVGTAGAIPVMVAIVSRWFERKRGLALGIATSGSGLGTLLIAPLAAYLISMLGWRMSYLVLGLIAMALVVSLATLLRKDPSEIRALPRETEFKEYGTELRGKLNSYQVVGISLKQALKTRNFWLILAMIILFASSLNLVITHIVAHATDIGVPVLHASTVLSIMSGIQIAARLLVGKISDVAGRKIPGIVCLLLGGSALIWLIWSHDLWMLYVFAIAFGISWGGFAVVTFALVSDIFGRCSLGAIMGALEAGFAAGAAIGSFVGGLTFDITGNYSIAFSLGAGIILIPTLLIVLTKREVSITVE